MTAGSLRISSKGNRYSENVSQADLNYAIKSSTRETSSQPERDRPGNKRHGGASPSSKRRLSNRPRRREEKERPRTSQRDQRQFSLTRSDTATPELACPAITDAVSV